MVLGAQNVVSVLCTQNFSNLNRGYFAGLGQVILPDVFPTFPLSAKSAQITV